MKLSEYIYSSRGSAKRLADSIGVSTSSISYWASGEKKPSVDHCFAIEEATHGVVRCEEIRPEYNWRYLRTSKAA